MAKFKGIDYKPRPSHVFLGVFALAFACLFSLWTWPLYVTYRGRESYVSQFCLIRGGSNATGCVTVELLYDTECDNIAAANLRAAQVNASGGGRNATGPSPPPVPPSPPPPDCKNLCVYSDHQREVGYNATTERQRDAFVRFYVVGAEVPCYHPPGKLVDGLTFTQPRNPTEDFVMSVMGLVPVVLGLLTSCHCAMQKPRDALDLEEEEMLSGLYDEVVVQRDRQKTFVADQDKKLNSLQARIEREQEKRIEVVLDVQKERKERLLSEDNIKHAVQDHLKALESKLVTEMAARLAHVTGKRGARAVAKAQEKYLKAGGRAEDAEKLLAGHGKGRSDDRALARHDPGAIYEEHARGRERRAAALSEDRDAQRMAFHRRLQERRGGGGGGKADKADVERGPREEGRRRSKDPDRHRSRDPDREKRERKHRSKSKDRKDRNR